MEGTMKYCSQCGHELDDNAIFCSSCGASTQPQNRLASQATQNQKSSNASLQGKGVGILLTFFTGVIGLILCYVMGDEDCKKGALTCFIVCLIIGVILGVIYGFFIFSLIQYQ